MCSSDGEKQLCHSVITSRSYNLNQFVIAIINTVPLEIHFRSISNGIGAILMFSSIHNTLGFPSKVTAGIFDMFKQLKSSTGQAIEIRIDLISVYFIGKNNVFVRGSFAVTLAIRVVGEYQMSLIRVAGRTKDSSIIQSSFVLNSDYRTVDSTKNLYISNLDLQSFGGCIPSEFILGRGQRSSVDFDRSTISDISQICHGIDKLYIVFIVVVQLAQSSGQLIRNNIADIVVSRILPVRFNAGGIIDVLDLLLKGGDISLDLRSYRGCTAYLQQAQILCIVLIGNVSGIDDQVITSARQGYRTSASCHSCAGNMISSDFCKIVL